MKLVPAYRPKNLPEHFVSRSNDALTGCDDGIDKRRARRFGELANRDRFD